MKKPRFIISGGGTGGHIYPAVAIANELKSRFPEAEFLFIGAKDKMDMQKVPPAGYAIKATLQLINSFETANPPVIAVNSQNDEIYVTDPGKKQLHRVDLKTMASTTLPLDFTPAKMTWVGIAKPAS